MTSAILGLLHPGDMGTSVGLAAQSNGARVVWAADGRTVATAQRATAAGFEPLPDLGAVVARSHVIVSVCPPHAAEALAQKVVAVGFRGLYIDANAICPDRARRIATLVTTAGGRFVDGGIIGNPPRGPGETRLYLSGPDAEQAAALFRGTLQEPVVVGPEPGTASALKMVYAAWNKGQIALRLAVAALARREGVEGAFTAEWARSQPGLMERTRGDAIRVPAKAWRWIGEMQEIASTFERAGLPSGFHEASGAIYEFLTRFKDAEPPNFDEVMAAMLER
jgi:3-hydroxyisobutyrate dehydrogenase-like beta-hydroxyacid dehydrogenase